MGRISALILFFALTGATSAFAADLAAEGLVRYRVGDYVGAMETFRLARSDDMSKEAYMAWGMSALKMGKYRSAAAKFGMAAGKDPKDGDPLALMGESYLRDGAPREAIASFARIGNRPLSDPAGVKILWATADNHAGAYAQGLALFREASTMAPPERRGEIDRGMGASLLGLRRYDEAEAVLMRHLRAHPDDAGGWGLAGEASLRRGFYNQAVERLQNALAKGASVGPTAYNLACAESRRSRTDEACAALRRSCASGFDCRTPALTDPDLTPVRKSGCLDRPRTEPEERPRPRRGGPPHDGGGSAPREDRPARSQSLSR